MANLILNPQATMQRSYAAGTDFGNMRQYLEAQVDNPDFDPDATVIAVSIPDGQSIFCLNAIAGFILEATILHKDEPWIRDTLLSLFEVDPAELESDIRETLDNLKSREILL